MSCKIVITACLAFYLAVNLNSGFLFKRRRPLAIDGAWSNWQSWSQCYLNSANNSYFFSKFNGFIVRSRQRYCDSPRPAQGGQDCTGSAFRYKQCGCDNPLGMESGRIGDKQLFSNARTVEKFAVNRARFGHESAWCSEDSISPLLDMFYRIDLVNFTQVSAIGTRGIPLGRVSRYKLYHSLNGKKWDLYSHKRTASSEIIGNILPNTVKLNEFDEPIIARFLKIVPLHFYNRVCMKFEVYGCPYTCGEELTSAAGEIVARSSESHDENCLWKINVKNTTKITLDFVTFEVPCADGIFEIRVGTNSYRQSRVFKRICGYDLSIGLIKIPSNSLWIKFYSNSSSDEVSFRVRYISECSENLVLNPTEVLKIHSPNYPLDYFDNNDCTWNVSSDSSKVYVSFKAFDVESGEKVGQEDCHNDFVSIQGFDEHGKPGRQTKYCNSQRPLMSGASDVLDARKMIIKFKSDNAIAGKGFLLEVTAFDPSKGKPVKIPPSMQKTTQNPNAVLGYNEVEFKTTFSTDASSGISTSKVVITNGSREGNASRSSNDTALNGKHAVKKKVAEEPDWTIFTVAAFSCFVFILIVFVTVVSIRKCTSQYRGESGKFLPAISKKGTKDPSYETNEGLLNKKAILSQANVDEQFCEMNSPAGSIQVGHCESGSDNGEQEQLTADIVNHTLKREARTIDMYTDGAEITEHQVNVEIALADEITEETVV